MELNTIQQQGKWSNIADRLNENFSAINSELLKILAKTRANKGFFETPSDLIEVYPTAVIGDVAYVGISDVFYIFKWDGTDWVNTGLTIEENIDINGVNERIEAIQSNLNTVSNELSQAISQETTNREALEARLSQEISNTQANIEQVNNALSQEIAELAQTIATETDTREKAMTAMAKNIQAMIDEEKYYREAGDTVLTEALDAEKIDRENKDNELERTLQALVLGAKASCVVSPNVIHKNATTEVSVTGSISNVKATAISIEGDNYKNSTDEDTGSFDTVFPIQTSKDITFIVKATYNGVDFPASAMLYAVDKIYYGAGTSASAATNVVSPRRTPAGTYSLTTQSGDYVWWLVPSTMSISKATLNGFNFPIKQDGTTSVDGVSYKIYKSENQYSASTMNIVVS